MTPKPLALQPQSLILVAVSMIVNSSAWALPNCAEMHSIDVGATEILEVNLDRQIEIAINKLNRLSEYKTEFGKPYFYKDLNEQQKSDLLNVLNWLMTKTHGGQIGDKTVEEVEFNLDQNRVEGPYPINLSIKIGATAEDLEKLLVQMPSDEVMASLKNDFVKVKREIAIKHGIDVNLSSSLSPQKATDTMNILAKALDEPEVNRKEISSIYLGHEKSSFADFMYAEGSLSLEDITASPDPLKAARDALRLVVPHPKRPEYVKDWQEFYRKQEQASARLGVHVWSPQMTVPGARDATKHLDLILASANKVGDLSHSGARQIVIYTEEIPETSGFSKFTADGQIALFLFRAKESERQSAIEDAMKNLPAKEVAAATLKDLQTRRAKIQESLGDEIEIEMPFYKLSTDEAEKAMASLETWIKNEGIRTSLRSANVKGIEFGTIVLKRSFTGQPTKISDRPILKDNILRIPLTGTFTAEEIQQVIGSK